jgi:Putative binding domain, N-terminal
VAGAASFSVGNTGGGTMTYVASVISGLSWLRITSGQSGGNSGTINVHYDANTGALRSGTIQVRASGASGSPVTVSVTQAASRPVIAVHLVDPFLLGANLSSINLSPLYSAQNWAAVEAKGLVADGVSAAIAVVQTNDCASNIALTTRNGRRLSDGTGVF